MVILEKTPFTEDTLAEMFNGSTVKPDMTNYIYSTYHLQASPHLNGTVAREGSGAPMLTAGIE